MRLDPLSAPTEHLNATAYRRAHAGKLMIVQPKEGQGLTRADFFEMESVGTHPTGLYVTGIFENARRSHTLSTQVRDANATEIEWLRAAQTI